MTFFLDDLSPDYATNKTRKEKINRRADHKQNSFTFTWYWEQPYPLTVTETAKVLGVSRNTIYRYVKKMKEEKKILK